MVTILLFFIKTVFKGKRSSTPPQPNPKLSLCRLETPKRVLWQTAKTQMKCHIMWHFIRVCNVCKDKIDFQRKKSLDPVQAQQDINPSLYPNCLTLTDGILDFLFSSFVKANFKISARHRTKYACKITKTKQTKK